MKVTSAIIATGLVGHAAATWNMFGSPFNSPNYNNNECSDKQKAGFDWSDLKDGDSNFNYGDFDFSAGWKCSNSFGKRDLISKRTFGSKCIKNKVSKDKPASFGCNKRKSGFSITHIDVSVEFDVDLELHYTMEDGSKCKQVAPCSSSGSTIQNTQCGGAKTVDVYLPKHDKSDKECEIGFHNIGFDCNPGKGYTPPSPPSPPSPPKESSSSPPVASKPASSAPASSAPATEVTVSSSAEVPSSTTEVSVPTPPATETPSTPCGGYGQETCEGSTAISSAPATSHVPGTFSSVHYTNSSVPATTAPATQETPASQPPTESTSAPACDGSYGASCEGTTAVTSAVSTPLTSTVSSYSVILSTGVSQPSPSPSSPSYSPVSPPDVLPKCMNTWLEISGDCKNNADASCYCKNKDFTKNVIDCVSAWCGTDDETRQSLQYLIGICAEHVPENPGLVTDCPSYIPLNPTPASPTAPAGGVSTPAGETTAPAVPGTTPAPAESTPCTTITMGSTTLTIPQVHFTTETNEAGAAAPTEPVGLVPGTAPAQTPASTTAAAPYPTVPVAGTTLATFKPSGTGALSPTSPAEFTGAAVPFKLEAQHAILGAMLAFFAL
ncbi:hypothetical protein SLS61_006556 [Didymella pomorum]|jgi:hypothetical protein